MTTEAHATVAPHTRAGTVAEIVLRATERPERDALTAPGAELVSYAELAIAVREIAGGLAELGIQRGDHVGILAGTRPAWTLADFGALCAGATVVPIYPTNSPQECEYILEHAAVRTVFCEDAGQVAKVQQVSGRCPALEHLIVLDGEQERAHYERHTAAQAEHLAQRLGSADVVLLHDPQTAGMIPRFVAMGVPVIWRAHIGLDMPNDQARDAWRFLIPYVERADAFVFSRPTYAWEGLDPAKLTVIAPSIDAFSPKNQAMPFTGVTRCCVLPAWPQIIITRRGPCSSVSTAVSDAFSAQRG